MKFTSETGRLMAKNTRNKTVKEREEYINFFIEKLSSGYGKRKATEEFKEKFDIHNDETPCQSSNAGAPHRYIRKSLRGQEL